MSHFEIVCAVIVGAFAVARVGRLIGFDSYPPAAKFRVWWDSKVTNDWNKLVHCGYCSTPYLAAADLAWGYCTDLQLAWWLVNIWLAGSYAAAIVIAYDGDE